MRKIILAALFIIFHCSIVQSQSKSMSMELNDTWFGLESSLDGNPVILRGRDHLNNFKKSGIYSNLIELTWKMENPTDNGIPTPKENIFMGEIEDALIESLEYDLQTILTIVHTTNNERTWIFYTTSVSEFGKRLNNTLSNYRRIPIEMETEEDADWDLYSEILANHQVRIK